MIDNTNKKSYLFCILLFLLSLPAVAQNTVVRGVIKDATTKEPLPFVTVRFDGTSIGVFSDENGKYRLTGNKEHTQVSISFIGYKTQEMIVAGGRTSTKDILLESEDLLLNEVIITPKKAKYSKKDNPAVLLIKKVIEHKDDNNISSQDYYQYEEYEQLMLALNNFKPEQSQFKKFKFIPNYIDTSAIDGKPILPFSVREKISDIYYRKNPKSKKKVVKGFKLNGLDQAFDTQAINTVLDENLQSISIYDNSITMLMNKFVSPLSEQMSVNFYKWYIEDTVTIDNERYIDLSFAPFNSRDNGFTGHLYISTDGSYGVKRAVMNVPTKINVNFVDQLIIRHEFQKNEFGKWIPLEQRMSIDLTLYDVIDVYADKIISYNKMKFNEAIAEVHQQSAPIVFEKDYIKRTDDFWIEKRPDNYKKDYRMDKMMQELKNMPVAKIILDAANLVASGYVSTSKDVEKNKLDLGVLPSLYSYNSLEGNRFRLTASTTNKFHPHLYLYGYTAYGTRDNKFKYMAEVSWAFNEIQYHKDEYPKSNITIKHSYDITNLGQKFSQAERDNILLSLKTIDNEKLVYSRQTELNYEKEHYSGLLGKIGISLYDQHPANIRFEKMDYMGNKVRIDKLNFTELQMQLRYAHKEKYIQQRRKRYPIPAERFIVDINHTTGLKNILNSDYQYNKSSLSIQSERWIAPFGKITANVDAEKIWGEVSFPLLITPSVNNSFTIQKNSFYMLQPLEFMHDSQVKWEVYYYMDGFIFNRIPLIRSLKWREIIEFRGMYGRLNSRNNPKINRNVLIFPEQSFTTDHGAYMEYNIGVTNIFKFLRIDYVRRVNYLDHPNVKKDGFRVSFDVRF